MTWRFDCICSFGSSILSDKLKKYVATVKSCHVKIEILAIVIT